MREILFKAKSKKGDIWVEGYYCKMDETTKCFDYDYDQNPPKTLHFIIEEVMTDWSLPNEFVYREIIPETLCRFTSLINKSGRMIWENDIVKDIWSNDTGIVKFGTYTNCFDREGVEVQHIGFYVDWGSNNRLRKDLGYWINLVDAEILGNVWDVPKWLKTESND